MPMKRIAPATYVDDRKRLHVDVPALRAARPMPRPGDSDRRCALDALIQLRDEVGWPHVIIAHMSGMKEGVV